MKNYIIAAYSQVVPELKIQIIQGHNLQQACMKHEVIKKDLEEYQREDPSRFENWERRFPETKEKIIQHLEEVDITCDILEQKDLEQ